jgi:hypothetical protein
MSKFEKIRPWIPTILTILIIQFTSNSLVEGIKSESSVYFLKIHEFNQSILLAKQKIDELSREIQILNDKQSEVEVAKEVLGFIFENETKVVFHN